MKHSKGKWKSDFIYSAWDIIVGGVKIAENIGGKTNEEREANAKLIAEAGTVANETGKTPRQLADENKELLEALKLCRKYLFIKNEKIEETYEDMDMNCKEDSLWKIVKEAINNCN